MQYVVVLIPVYNDWQSAKVLIREINNQCTLLPDKKITFLLVNDCSTEFTYAHHLEGEDSPEDVRFVDLVKNVGHQKAIAIGLSYIVEEIKPDLVVVMDADGEDRPEDFTRLLQKNDELKGGRIVFAHRTKRQEGPLFRFFYKIYKSLFKVLTGKYISFGNFSLLPIDYAARLVHLPEIWTHYAGAVMRSKFTYVTMPTERGTRYFGTTKMNFISLVMHGLSGISNYMDVVAVRLIVASILLIAVSLIVLLSILIIRFFTDLAIPGWATFTSLGLVIILFQAFFLGFFSVFLIISQKTTQQIIPILEYRKFIFATHKLSTHAGI